MQNFTPSIYQNEIRTPDTRGSGTIDAEHFHPPGGHNKYFSQKHSTPLAENFSEKNLSSLPLSEKSPENFQVTSSPQSQISEKNSTEIAPLRTSYDPSFGPQMYEWFKAKEKFHISFDSFAWKSGEVRDKERKIANPPPHFSEFARTINTTKRTLDVWAKKYPEFGEYYLACMDIIQEFMIDNGVTGEYASQFTIFAAKNTTKMKDVQETLNKNVNFKDMLDAIEKGKIFEDDF